MYVTNATVGVSIVARSLDLGPGDEVLGMDLEYGACDRTWRFLSQKRGFTYNRQPIAVPLTSIDDFLEQLWQGVTAQTRVIFFSHITSSTATIFQVAEVCRRAREQGIQSLVDGVHAPGQIQVLIEEVGADFYTGNLHKLKVGDKVFVHTFGELCIYEVKSISQRNATDPAILQHEDISWLILVTCADYSESAETYLKRLVVKAVLVQVQPEPWQSD